MVLTGPQIDRLNGKWTMAVALIITIISNLMLPLLAATHLAFAFSARILCGIADALLTPSISSMIARWFPPKERPFAIGFITGGRQIGSLLILPVAGWVCSNKETSGGWKLTFYISAAIGTLTLLVWLVLSADKPAKHCCVKSEEALYILRKISEESLGKVCSFPNYRICLTDETQRKLRHTSTVMCRSLFSFNLHCKFCLKENE
ncbi:unnamed protein product [Gongylonema pulchrum]|uniref:MFS domain-containing protein n=1 Tax=Gongylonema pulchrum TaxID=637853 RepID=A0A183D8E1_9BILA|nr:unnamed protein product [Gongylonema pulchrum]